MSTESLINSNTNDTSLNPRLALNDLFSSLTKWRMWLMLAYLDIKLRYRRSMLGPFWITLSMGITAYSMGYLYGHLFHTNMVFYFPYLVGGMISWALLSSCITELVETFTTSESLIKQIKLPYSLYIHKIVSRNIIVFFHNVFVIIPILIIFHESTHVNFATLLLIPGLLLFYLNAFIFGIPLAMLGARYRDISQMIKSLVQIIFFVTPVMWQPSSLPPDKQFFVKLNPFNSFVDIIRAPLIGEVPALSSYFFVFAVTLLGSFIAWRMFVKYRARIIYWL